MPRYRLHVDEVANRLNFLDVEISLNDKELDALLTKIEQGDVTSTLDLKRKLEAQGIRIKSFGINNQPFYRNAEVLEIEELKEPQKQGIMIKCKACDLTIENIEKAIEELRDKMHLSIAVNGQKANTTIQLSQDLDTLIVSYMGK